MSKRSSHIEAAFVSAVAAAAIAGCKSSEAYRRDWEQCVNQANIVVDDRLCETNRAGTSGRGGYYHWLYSPRPYAIGMPVRDGYARPLAPASVRRSSSVPVSRGGFGSSSHRGTVG